MIKVKMVFSSLDLEATLKAGKEIRKELTENHIVASTKSFNNLVDDLKANGKVATKTEEIELFIDKSLTVKALAEFIGTQIKDVETAKYIVNHCIKALDGACLFKKPAIIRSK